jgi:hypothetical protein
MSELETIDILVLSTVTGGGSSTTEGNLGVQVPTPRGPVQVGAQARLSQTDYNACLATVRSMPGAKPSDTRDACGLPPAN